MTSYCQYTPDKKEQSTQNQTKICAIIVFYVYFVLYIELLFGDVGLNGSLNKKIDKIRYDNSDKGVEISYFGAAFIVLYQGGALGAAIYFINSTEYTFQHTKISDTFVNYKVTFSSVDRATGTFNIAWDTASYVTYLIPLV